VSSRPSSRGNAPGRLVTYYAEPGTPADDAVVPHERDRDRGAVLRGDRRGRPARQDGVERIADRGRFTAFPVHRGATGIVCGQCRLRVATVDGPQDGAGARTAVARGHLTGRGERLGVCTCVDAVAAGGTFYRREDPITT